MVFLHSRVEAPEPLKTSTPSASSSGSSANSFSKQLATAFEGAPGQTGAGASVNIQVRPLVGRDPGGSQNSGGATASPTATTTGEPAGYGTIEALFSGGAAAAPANTTNAAAASPAPQQTELQAYWAAQPPAVQALQNMPVGPARTALAQNLEQQGYPIDYDIMVQGWDPQITMTMRQQDGYAWVPSMGQPSILVAPGVSMPGESDYANPSTPASAPAGSILVSTAFAAGTVQNINIQKESAYS